MSAKEPVIQAAKTSAWFNLTSAMLAFGMWGGWAYYVNRGHSPWVSGLTQGIASFVITLLMVRAVAWIYHCVARFPLAVFWPAAMVIAITGSFLAVAHACVGTENIAQTIAPALSVAFVFNVFTAVKLSRMKKENQPE